MAQTQNAKANLTLSARRLSFRAIIFNEYVLVAAFLIAVLCFTFRDIVFGGNSFILQSSLNGQPGTGAYGYGGSLAESATDSDPLFEVVQPWDRFISLAYQAKQIPLWNPHQGLGVPLYANGGNGAFDPIHALIFLAPTQWWSAAIDIHLLLRFFLAGFFTYALVRALGVGSFGALVASLAYMLAPYFVQYQNISFIWLDTLLPLLLFAFYRLAVKPSFGSFLLVVIAIFLLIVGNFPETLAVHVGFGAWWYAHLSGMFAGQSTRKLRVWLVMIGRGLAAVLTGVLSGAFVLLPFVQYLALAYHFHTPEMIAALQVERVWPIERLAGFLTPESPVSRLSVITLVCVLLGLAASLLARRLGKAYQSFASHTVFFAGSSLLIILVSFRVSVFAWIADLPLVNMIYLNRSVQPLLLLSTACLAAIGIDFIFAPRTRNRLTFSLLASILALGLLLLAIRLNPALEGLSFLKYCLLFLVGINGAVAIATRGTFGIRIAAALTIVLLLADLGAFWPLVHELRYDPFTEPPFVTYLKGQPGPFRIVATHGILLPNVSSAMGIDDLRFVDALNPKNLFDFTQRFLTFTDTPTYDSQTRFDGRSATPIFGRAMDVLNVAYVLTPDATPPSSADGDSSRFEMVHQSDDVYVYRNKNVYPRAWTVNSAEVVPDEMQTFERLLAKDFDPRHSVLLSEPLSPDIQGTLAPSAPRDQKDPVVLDTGNTTTVHVDMVQPGFLVLSNLYYPGWEATVDGQPAHIYEAYQLVRAVYLNAGSHVVEFSFRPPLFIAGLVITGLVALCLLVVGAVRLAQHYRRATREDRAVG